MVREGGLAAMMPAFPTYLLPSFGWIPFSRRPSGSKASTTPSTAAPPNTSTTNKAASPDEPSPDTPDDPAAEPSKAPGTKTRRSSRTAADTIKCMGCSSDLAFASQIISKGFTGRFGRAYLVSPATNPLISSASAGDLPSSGSLMNIRVGRSECRQLVTGWHTVADISCAICGRKLGWKYVDAKEAVQKYKVGKFILETEKVVTHRHWGDVEEEEDDDNDDDQGEGGGEGEGEGIYGEAWRRGGMGGEDEDEGEIEFDLDDSEECEDLFAAVWDARVVAARRKNAARRGKGKAVRRAKPG